MNKNKLKILDCKVSTDSKVHPNNMQWTFLYDEKIMDFINIQQCYGE